MTDPRPRALPPPREPPRTSSATPSKQDLATGRFTYVRTRWPPEPNGYLHIGHAKAICLDFGIAAEFGGKLQFPLRRHQPREGRAGVRRRDHRGRPLARLRVGGPRVLRLRTTSSSSTSGRSSSSGPGKAYVCDLSEQQIREYRGTDVADKGPITVTPPGRNSPYRDRSVDENLDLFRRMRAGEFPDGARTLRAKIDMAHPNLHMRDPVMYRIRHASHHRTGDAWCIYPMYDYQHPLSDSIEGVTHSLCSLEYEIHRPLYDWFLENLGIFHSRQIEFARLNLTHTVMSKRWLLELVKDGRVKGWDDPRMPTLVGPAPARLHARGHPGLRLARGHVQDGEHGGHRAPGALPPRGPQPTLRAGRMAVLKPLKLVIENWPAGKVEEMEAVNNPEDPSAGTRHVPFSGELYIEQDDVREVPPPKYYRLYPGNQVRLRYAYIVTCTGVRKDPSTGEIREVRCTYDPPPAGGNAPDNRKVKATIHWVSAAHALPAEARLYDHLFTAEYPQEVPAGVDWKDTDQPGLPGGRGGRAGGAGACRCPAGRPVPVREAGLLLRGPGLRARERSSSTGRCR